MPIEQQPSKPLPANFVPPRSRPYKVVDGDNWANIGARERVDVLQLIDFNFGTLKPALVNWYLHHRVGCNQTTSNKHNYIFSSSANPGIIHLPTAPAPAPLNYGALRISISGDSDYQSRIRWLLDHISRSDTGQALFIELGLTLRKMQIRPFDLNGATCTAQNRNAYAAADDARAATGKNEWYYRDDDFKTPRDERFDPVMEPSIVRGLLGLPLDPMVGTGTGSDVTVSFSPEMWGHGNICGSAGSQPGASPSEVLFHEIVHGYRSMTGRLVRMPTVGTKRQYDNEEEFLAVVVSNIYTDDPTNPSPRRALRADHWNFNPLPGAQSSTQGFLSQPSNRRMVEKLAKQEPSLAARLKRVKGAFNPFAGL